jgi:hypothetical protein
MTPSDREESTRMLKHAGFEIVECEDITPSVIRGIMAAAPQFIRTFVENVRRNPGADPAPYIDLIYHVTIRRLAEHAIDKRLEYGLWQARKPK